VSGDKFKNWPENLSREDLIHFVRGAMSEAVEVETILGAALGYPLGDGVVWPKDRRVTGEHTIVTLAMAAARKIQESSETPDYEYARGWKLGVDYGRMNPL